MKELVLIMLLLLHAPLSLMYDHNTRIKDFIENNNQLVQEMQQACSKQGSLEKVQALLERNITNDNLLYFLTWDALSSSRNNPELLHKIFKHSAHILKENQEEFLERFNIILTPNGISPATLTVFLEHDAPLSTTIDNIKPPLCQVLHNQEFKEPEKRDIDTVKLLLAWGAPSYATNNLSPFRLAIQQESYVYAALLLLSPPHQTTPKKIKQAKESKRILTFLCACKRTFDLPLDLQYYIVSFLPEEDIYSPSMLAFMLKNNPSAFTASMHYFPADWIKNTIKTKALENHKERWTQEFTTHLLDHGQRLCNEITSPIDYYTKDSPHKHLDALIDKNNPTERTGIIKEYLFS
ncbi:MAG: hypothetical protein AB7R69_05810 [Candidatus Babeliales bacterium]